MRRIDSKCVPPARLDTYKKERESNLLSIKESVLKSTFDKKRVVVYLETIEALMISTNSLLSFETQNNRYVTVFNDKHKIMFVGIDDEDNYIHIVLLSDIRSYSLSYSGESFEFKLHERRDATRTFVVNDKNNYLKVISFLNENIKKWD